MKLTAEPTRAEPYGARIRRLLASPEATWPEPMALALLFAQDREQHRRDVVDPAIAQGLHVVCDRGLLSSLALQGPRVGFQAVLALNAGAKRPDLTLWLDLEPEQAAARLASRPGAMTAFEGHAALRWADVDLEQRRLHVRRSWYRGAITTPKGGRARVVDLAPSAASLLARVVPLAGAELVFANPDGSPVTRDQLKGPWERVTRAAGLPRTTPHDARHSFASQLVQAGVALPAVQQLLGHTDIRVTMRYAHLAPGATASAVALLDGDGHRMVTAEAVGAENGALKPGKNGGGGGSRTKRGRPPKLRLVR